MHNDKNFSSDSIQILPDGKEVKIGVERKIINEILFDPNLLGKDIKSIPELIIEPLNKLGMHMKKELTENILVIGGTSNTSKFAERLKAEVDYKLNSCSSVKYHFGSNRDRAQWVGASFYFIGDNSD